jgi:hypothetical protein
MPIASITAIIQLLVSGRPALEIDVFARRPGGRSCGRYGGSNGYGP